MSNKRKIKKAIKNGDLEGLKKVLQKEPTLADMHLTTWDTGGNLLHLAAYYNQTILARYLVQEQGMDVNALDKVERNTPLHIAAERRLYEMGLTLLELGANPNKWNMTGTPLRLCKDLRLKKAMQDKIDQEEQQAEQEKQEQRAATVKAAAVKSEERAGDRWVPLSVSEIMHDRDLPGGRYHLTQIFNLATDSYTTITEHLKSGKTETHNYDKMSEKMRDEAQAQLDKINGAEEKNTARPVSDYGRIIKAAKI